MFSAVWLSGDKIGKLPGAGQFGPGLHVGVFIFYGFLMHSLCRFFSLAIVLLFSLSLRAEPGYPGDFPAQNRWERRGGSAMDGTGEGGRLGREESQERRQERREARRQWLDSRQAERAYGADERGSLGGEWGGRRRLSPEERQRLRQDVHDAGREVYPREERFGPRGPDFPRRP